jgi:hypothetical protein
MKETIAPASVNKHVPFPRGTGNFDLRKNATVEEKRWLANEFSAHTTSTPILMKRYNVSLSTLDKYRSMLKKNKPFHSFNGRPRLLSLSAKKIIGNQMRSKNSALTTKEYDKLVLNAIASDRKEQGNMDPDDFSVSKSSLRRMQKELGVGDKKCERITDARRDACADLRNMICFAAMNSFMLPRVQEALIINMDSTQYQLGGFGDSLQKAKIFPQQKGKNVKVETCNFDVSLSYFIKYYLVMSAVGVKGDPIFVLQDDAMGDEEIDIHELTGLDLHSVVHVIFCKTRGCNKSFYDWLNVTYLPDFVSKLRSTHGLTENDAAFIQMDGESLQVAAYTRPKVLECLKENNIYVGKSSPSCSAIQQPCDIGDAFRGSKRLVVLRSEVEDNKYTLAKVAAIFDKHNQTLQPRTASLSFAQRTSAIAGILQAFAKIQRVISMKVIQESFEKCGICPFDIDKMLKKCTDYEQNVMEVTDICAKMPVFKKEFAERGWLSDAVIQKELPNLKVNGKDRNNCAMCYRRACIMNSDGFLRLGEDEKEKAELDAARKVAEKAAKKAAKEAEALAVLARKKERLNRALLKKAVKKKRVVKSKKGLKLVRKLMKTSNNNKNPDFVY